MKSKEMMDLDETLATLATEPTLPVDLAEVGLHLCRDEFPEIAIQDYMSFLDRLGNRLRMFKHGTLASRVAALTQIFCVEEEFRGDSQRYYDPDNSYLCRVIDRRLGLPITLSILALSIGRRAGLTIDGIALPGHFLARATFDNEIIYFDAFYGGRIVDVNECEKIVEKATGRPFGISADDLYPATAQTIVRRVLSNLKAIYLRQGDFRRASRVIGRIVQIEPDNVLEHRDLAVCLFKSGQSGRSIRHFEYYLAAQPVSEDGEVVRQLLKQAKAEVARWN